MGTNYKQTEIHLYFLFIFHLNFMLSFLMLLNQSWSKIRNLFYFNMFCYLIQVYCTLLIQPGVTLKYAKEGTESSAFWFPLGGKQSYSSKKAPPEIARDPHLFTFSFNKGGVLHFEVLLTLHQFNFMFA